MEELLMICDADLAPGDTFHSVVTAGICLISKAVEPAGRSFLEKYEIRASSKQRRKAGQSPTSVDEDEDTSERAETWRAKGKSKSGGGGGGGGSASLASGSHLKRILAYEKTLYQILEVDEGATLDEIKKQYRRKVLEYHPDKAKNSKSGSASPPSQSTADADTPGAPEHEAFLKIQEAYEALSDPNFRKQYDSSLPFDESIPTAAECSDAAKFYAVFGAAFQRNARWSSRRPVPSLGDDATSLNAVEKFYDFWFDFESWRDFGVHDEHDVNEAECREERRWMERENAKIRKKYLKNERARIQKLVETAYAADPRIQRQKEEERRRREEEKAAKQRALEAQMREAAELKKREEEEAQRREEEAKQLLKQQQQERQTLKKWRQKFRWFHRRICEDGPEAGKLETTQVQDLSMQLELDELIAFCRKIHECLKLQEPVSNSEGEPSGPCELSFSEDQRASVSAFYAERWKQFQEAQETKKQAAEEEMRRVQEERRRQELERKKAQEAAWKVNELSLLAKGLQRFPPGTSRRWQQIADFIGTKTQEQVVAKAKEMAQGSSLKSMGQKISLEVLEQSKAQNQASASSTGNDAKREDPTSSAWTKEQQNALESALAKYPSSMPPSERWTAIANEVPGKTRKECVERFKVEGISFFLSISTVSLVLWRSDDEAVVASSDQEALGRVAALCCSVSSAIGFRTFEYLCWGAPHLLSRGLLFGPCGPLVFCLGGPSLEY
ncbi:hypothetical protein Emed_001879 [Eimeria media]